MELPGAHRQGPALQRRPAARQPQLEPLAAQPHRLLQRPFASGGGGTPLPQWPGLPVVLYVLPLVDHQRHRRLHFRRQQHQRHRRPVRRAGEHPDDGRAQPRLRAAAALVLLQLGKRARAPHPVERHLRSAVRAQPAVRRKCFARPGRRHRRLAACHHWRLAQRNVVERGRRPVPVRRPDPEGLRASGDGHLRPAAALVVQG